MTGKPKKSNDKKTISNVLKKKKINLIDDNDENIIQEKQEEQDPVVIEPDQLRLAELFAGTGAFSLAFNNTKKIKVVFSNDIDANCKKSYDLNFDTKMTLGDINDMKPTTVPKMDILTGGFPCQAFSIAGEQKGFEDPRGNLFWAIIKIAKHHKPACMVLENVKNLQSHDQGKTFTTIKGELEKIGYTVKHQILNSCEIANVPQNRERIYIVCFRDKKKAEAFNFPTSVTRTKNISDILEIPITKKNNKSTVPEKYKKYYYDDRFKIWDALEKGITKKVADHVVYQYRRYYVRENKNGVCPTLTANMGGGGHNVPFIKDDYGIRKLTPRECFRLQGFPDTYQLPEISDSSLYKQAGNAVTVSVVEKIAQEVIRVLELK